MGKILVTGATGFIGSALAAHLVRAGRDVCGTMFRSAPEGEIACTIAWCNIGAIGAGTDWRFALRDVDTVIHTAGMAHVTGTDAAQLAYEVNTRGTLELARSAARHGVARLVFLSSVHVVGTRTDGEPFTETSPLDPHGHYARSKRDAEDGLREIAAQTGLEAVVVRAPLVYGPGAPGNFRRLVGLVRTGLPLPLASVRNARSLVAVENLAEVLALCTTHAHASNETFLVSDGEDLSTPALLRLIATGLGVRARLLPAPPALLALAGRLVGRAEEVEKLCQSLQVDSGKLRERLGWRPRESTAQSVIAAARAFAQDAQR